MATDSKLACRIGCCSVDMLEEVKQQLHDALIDSNPVRLGPVGWNVYGCDDIDELESMVRQLGFGVKGQEAIDTIREWEKLAPGTSRLVVAMVPVPKDQQREWVN